MQKPSMNTFTPANTWIFILTYVSVLHLFITSASTFTLHGFWLLFLRYTGLARQADITDGRKLRLKIRWM